MTFLGSTMWQGCVLLLSSTSSQHTRPFMSLLPCVAFLCHPAFHDLCDPPTASLAPSRSTRRSVLLVLAVPTDHYGFHPRSCPWVQMYCQSINYRRRAFTEVPSYTTAPSRPCGTGLSCFWSSIQRSSRPTQLPFCSATRTNHSAVPVAIPVAPSLWWTSSWTLCLLWILSSTSEPPTSTPMTRWSATPDELLCTISKAGSSSTWWLPSLLTCLSSAVAQMR